MPTQWQESGFSGDGYLIFDTPVSECQWQVSVNRYGPPTARLFFMSDAASGGPLVLEARLAVLESDSDATIAAAARAWAESVIKDGTALRRLLFPPAEQT